MAFFLLSGGAVRPVSFARTVEHGRLDIKSMLLWVRSVHRQASIAREPTSPPRRPLAPQISRRAPPGDAAEYGAGHQPGAAGVIMVIEAADDFAGREQARDDPSGHVLDL